MTDDAPDDGQRDDKTQWAKDRTDWAEDRTLLANERTYAGWLRTGSACVALALGLKAVFHETQPTWLAQAVATVFLVAAVAIFAGSAQRSHAALKRIKQHDTRAQPAWRIIALAAILILGTAMTGVILWTL